MARDDFPAPKEGFVITNFLVVADQDRSRQFYSSVFGAKVVRERDPVILRVANTWLILNVGGGPTDDKPTVTLSTPTDPNPFERVHEHPGGRHRTNLCRMVSPRRRILDRAQGPRL